MVRKLLGVALALTLGAASGCVSTGTYNADMKAQKALTQQAMDKAAAVQKSADTALAEKDKEIQALNKTVADIKAAAAQSEKNAVAGMEILKNRAAALETAQKEAVQRAERAEAETRDMALKVKSLEVKIAELTKQLEEAKKAVTPPAPVPAPAK